MITMDLDDFLERYDIFFADFDDMPTLLFLLDNALGGPASAKQIDAAVFQLQVQRQQAIDTGFTLDRFVRAGREVTQLRDARGRFVTAEEFDIDARGRRVVIGAGNIEAALAKGAG